MGVVWNVLRRDWLPRVQSTLWLSVCRVLWLDLGVARRTAHATTIVTQGGTAPDFPEAPSGS